MSISTSDFVTGGGPHNTKSMKWLEKQLKDLRSEHITTKSQLMYVSKQTEVEKLVNNKGLRSTKDQPFVLIK